ncbi:phosphatidylinositol transfer protein alpha isoform-like isoform X2 [Lineus longissimus]
MTVEEYQVAQLYSVAEASKKETGGGDGIEVRINKPFDANVPDAEILRNEPWHIPNKPVDYKKNARASCPLVSGNNTYTTGQYTEKVYKVEKKVPKWVATFAPTGSLHFEEKAWNAYPYCRTIIDNPKYMKEHFFLMIETMHCDDDGSQENVHNLSQEMKDKREIVYIDIANPNPKFRPSNEDPATFHSEKTGRGPLRTGEPKWYKDQKPLMCCYKLVSIYFKWWGLQTKVESFLKSTEERLFTNFHRQVCCWMDKWHGMTMDDIRALEDRTKEELDKQINTKEIIGTKGSDEPSESDE